MNKLRKYLKIFNMHEYFISLDPEEKLINLIEAQKDFVKKTTKNHKWADHKPKITAFIISTDDERKLVEKIKSLASDINKIFIDLREIKVHSLDARSSGKTITYPASTANLHILRNIQRKIIESLNKFNNKENFSKFVNINLLSENQKENLKIFGYPYVSEDWEPHFTLASISSEKFDEVLKYAEENRINGKFELVSISLYKGLDSPILIAKFPLN